MPPPNALYEHYMRFAPDRAKNNNPRWTVFAPALKRKEKRCISDIIVGFGDPFCMYWQLKRSRWLMIWGHMRSEGLVGRSQCVCVFGDGGVQCKKSTSAASKISNGENFLFFNFTQDPWCKCKRVENKQLPKVFKHALWKCIAFVFKERC